MPKNSMLNERHRQLGSKLDGETWNDMLIPWSYHTDPSDEVLAIRSAAGLYDITALNILNVSGEDAESVIDRLVAVDVTSIIPGTASLAAIVTEAGAICDDIMVIRDSATDFRLSHGTGSTAEVLAILAKGKKITINYDDDVHILSLQGPKSIDILEPHLSFDLASLPYFKHQKTSLFGIDIYIARGGYSGERGYEVYCAAKDAVQIWDKILQAGKDFGAIAASWDSLDLARIEAGLLFYPFDMPEGDTTPWEVNMGWGIDVNKKADYIGKQALLKLRGRQRIKHTGLIVNSATAVEGGDKIVKDGKEIGVVTSASFSRYLMQSIAMIHIKPEFSAIGTAVTVVGENTYNARVARSPFYDPQRLRTHPK